LYLIGLGLTDERDMTLRGLDIARSCDRVYLESYTSIYAGTDESLSELIGKEVIHLGRSGIEEDPENTVLAGGDVALLVYGDPLVATTHTDIILRARELGQDVEVVHNSSAYSAIAESGLQIYKFGRTTTIAYPEGTYFPKSPYDAIKDNRMRGLHTLCLLDIKADEDRFMAVNEAIDLLFRMEDNRMQNQIRKDTVAIGAARLGADSFFAAGTLEALGKVDFGKPPHCLVICGKLHEMELAMLKLHEV